MKKFIQLILFTQLIFSFNFLVAQNNALDFDGINDGVITGSPGPTGTVSRTVEAWIRVPNTNATLLGHICTWGATGNGQRFTIRVNNGVAGTNGALRLEVQGGFISYSTDIRDGNWHHVALVVTNDGSPNVTEARLYIDGVQDGTSASGSRAINTGTALNLSIGQSHVAGNRFLGSIDELRIWNVARTQAEIMANMNTEICTLPTPNLVAYYRFNQGLAGMANAGITNLPDLSGGSNNGTLQNFSLGGNLSNWVTGPTITVCPVPCLAPNSLTATNITATTADLGWTESGSATQWDVEYGLAGFTQGTGTMVTGTTTIPLSVSGLAANTAYDFYVRADCGASMLSGYSGPFSFTTSFAPPVGVNCVGSAPLLIFSDDLESNAAGWTGDISNNDGTWDFPTAGPNSTGTGPSGPQSGTMWVEYEASGDATNIASLVSPMIDLTSVVDDVELSFYFHAFGDAIGTLNVGVGTSATGPFTQVFTLTGEVQTTEGAPWQQVGVNLAAFLGQQIFIEFAYGGNGSDFTGDLALDLVEVNACTPCGDPTNLTASNITGTSADLGWTEAGVATTWDVEYGLRGFTQGTGTLVSSTTTNPHSISGLSPSTQYDFFVRADCGASGLSNWSGPFSFMTTIQGPMGVNCMGLLTSLVFSDDLETGAGWTGNTGGMQGTWRIPNSGGNSGSTGPSGPQSGSNWVEYEASGPTSTLASLVSPMIDLTSLVNDAELSFYFHAFGDAIGTLNVGVGTSPTGPFTQVFTITGQIQTAETDPWIQVGADISAFLGQQIYVEFLYAADGSDFTGDLAIDLVEVNSCSTCPQPTDLSTANLTGSSVDLAWVETGSATVWDVEYGLAGFTLGMGTLVTGTMTNPHSISGLSSNTEYEFYVRADCGGTFGVSGFAGPFSFMTPADYCAGDIFTDSGGSTGEYSNDENATTVICPDNVGETVVADFTFFDIELDFDFFNVFDGPDATFTQIGTDLTGELTGTNLPGPFVSSDPSGCLTFVFTSDGVVTDNGWEANISCGNPCFEPSDLTVNNVGSTFALLTWTQLGVVTEWDVEYGLTGFTQGTGTLETAINSNPYGISGLTEQTSYDYYVRANCGAQGVSAFVGPFTFVTQQSFCNNPSFTDTGGPTGDYSNDENITTVICPDEVGDVVSVTINTLDIEDGFDFLTVYNGSSNTAPFIEELSGTNFPTTPYISTDPLGCLTFVFTSDNSDVSTGWDATVSCISSCFAPVNLRATANMTTADLSWLETSTATNWNIEYGPAGFALGTGISIAGTTTNPHNLTGLTPNTDYEYYVRSNCALGDSSEYSGPFFFTTLVDINALLLSDCEGNCVKLLAEEGREPFLLINNDNFAVKNGNVKRIDVNNAFGAAITDYQVELDIVREPSMRADYGDLRFYDASGNMLTYYIESDNDPAHIFVKTDLDMGNNALYMTYGNSVLSSLSDAKATMAIFEDMSVAPEGTLMGNAVYVQNQFVRLTEAVGSQNGQLEYDMNFDEGFVADFEFFAGQGTGADGLYVYSFNTSTPVSETSNSGGYIAMYQAFADQVQLFWDGTRLDDESVVDIDNGIWRSGRVEYSGVHTNIDLDGGNILSFDDVARVKNGSLFGFGARTGGSHNIHNVRAISVRKYTPLVTITIGAESNDDNLCGFANSAVTTNDNIIVADGNGNLEVVNGIAVDDYQADLSGAVNAITKICQLDDWVYYGTNNNFSFGLLFNNDVATNGFDYNETALRNATVEITDDGIDAVIDNTTYSIPFATYGMSRYWNVNNTGVLDGPVDVRFFFDLADRSTMQNTAISFALANTLNLEAFQWFKIVDADYDPAIHITAREIIEEIELTDVSGGLDIDGVVYAQFDSVTSFSGGTGAIGVGNSPNSALPVELLSLNAEAIDNNYIKITWVTATEINNNGFELMRSTDGENFVKIAWIPGNGNSNERQEYFYDDHNVSNNMYYYKLKQVDFDGNFEEFPVVSARIEKNVENTEISISPIPTSKGITISFETLEDTKTEFTVYNYSGQKVLQMTKELQAGNSNIDIDEVDNLPPGVYFVDIVLNNITYTKRFVVAK